LRTTHLLGFLIAAASAAPLAAQSKAGSSSVAVYGGFAPNSDGAALMGLELRAFEGQRFAASLTANKWWRSTGCDQLVGIPCDDEAWSADAGLVVRLTEGHGRFGPYASARVGGLFYDGFHRGVWNPSLGIGTTWSGTGALGLVMEVRYHGLMDSREEITPNRPSTADYLVFQAGFRLRL
jgi:hypothetical protein